jgi:hypothetical protein
MDDSVKPIIEHYQKTYELTYELWQQRNRTFLLLLAVIGAATLLTFRVPQADSLLVDVVAKAAGVSNTARAAELRAGFPFALLQSIILMVVFYLMVNLYHRAVNVLRNYRYLSCLASEIRELLQLQSDRIAFTRESTFYWGAQSRLSGAVKWVYFGMLGLLLLAFLGGRVMEDVSTSNMALAIVDLLIGIPTLVFYVEYARSSISLDAAAAIVHSTRAVTPIKPPNEPLQPTVLGQTERRG